MYKFSFLFLLSMALLVEKSFAQKEAYRVFTGKGKKSDYGKLLAAASNQEFVFFGELHNNPIAHWLEFELLKDLAAQKQVSVGMEMFETDQQHWLVDYFAEKIEQKVFEKDAKPWNNYPTDYKPIVEFCKEKKLPLIATNVPRPYARMVAKNGVASLDTLPESDKKWICPLPYTIPFENPSYQKMEEMMGHSGTASKNFVSAQAIKDATMAHNILKNEKQGGIFLHFNGSYHSDYKEGIVWYIFQQKKAAKVLNISVVEQTQTATLDKEHLNKADFIIVVPESMTKTY
ncbi:MAG: ChaN family lipoprotein [Bacteroidia bacterium]